MFGVLASSPVAKLEITVIDPETVEPVSDLSLMLASVCQNCSVKDLLYGRGYRYTTGAVERRNRDDPDGQTRNRVRQYF